MKKMQTKQWYEAKVKLVRINEKGKEVKVSESYLIDAVTYEDAETRVYLEMESMGISVFTFSLTRSNISEVLPSEDESDDRWYKGKVAIIDADELTGKEKRVNQYVLVAAKDIDTALSYLGNSFSTYIVPYEICSISDTKIVDVYPYSEITESNTTVTDVVKEVITEVISNEEVRLQDVMRCNEYGVSIISHLMTELKLNQTDLFAYISNSGIDHLLFVDALNNYLNHGYFITSTNGTDDKESE